MGWEESGRREREEVPRTIKTLVGKSQGKGRSTSYKGEREEVPPIKGKGKKYLL